MSIVPWALLVAVNALVLACGAYLAVSGLSAHAAGTVRLTLACTAAWALVVTIIAGVLEPVSRPSQPSQQPVSQGC